MSRGGSRESPCLGSWVLAVAISITTLSFSTIPTNSRPLFSNEPNLKGVRLDWPWLLQLMADTRKVIRNIARRNISPALCALPYVQSDIVFITLVFCWCNGFALPCQASGLWPRGQEILLHLGPWLWRPDHSRIPLMARRALSRQVIEARLRH